MLISVAKYPKCRYPVADSVPGSQLDWLGSVEDKLCRKASGSSIFLFRRLRVEHIAYIRKQASQLNHLHEDNSEKGGIFSSKSSTAGSRTDQSAALMCDGLPCIRALHLSCMYSAHARHVNQCPGRVLRAARSESTCSPSLSEAATTPLAPPRSSVAASPASTQS
ncbi:hypothetical protein KC323_g310 [Hortaea werneckii]|nr:hypothetical protein KC323_g310 [Hortaea werneckii]